MLDIVVKTRYITVNNHYQTLFCPVVIDLFTGKELFKRPSYIIFGGKKIIVDSKVEKMEVN